MTHAIDDAWKDSKYNQSLSLWVCVKKVDVPDVVHHAVPGLAAAAAGAAVAGLHILHLVVTCPAPVQQSWNIYNTKYNV